MQLPCTADGTLASVFCERDRLAGGGGWRLQAGEILKSIGGDVMRAVKRPRAGEREMQWVTGSRRKGIDSMELCRRAETGRGEEYWRSRSS